MTKSYLESLLGKHEKILLTTRQHWLILAGSIFLEIVLILLIFAASVTAGIFFPEFIALIVAIGFAVLLLPIVTMTIDILNWSNRQYIVTNHRVIQIAGVFNKSITDSSLEKVNDVKMVQSALGRVFDYGDIEIMTASELGVNKLTLIGRPIQYKTTMINAKEKLERIPAPSGPRTSTPTLADFLMQLDVMRQHGVLNETEFQEKKSELLRKK